MRKMRKIILASQSPRRKQLLKMIGLQFKVLESDFNEVMNQTQNPHSLARQLSFEKAKAVSQKFKDAIVIGADTFIIVEKEFLGKAHSRKEAFSMLSKLSGKMHTVITGYTIIDTKTLKSISKSIESKVYFKKLTKREIDAYIDSKEPLEKAGAYAIQGKASIFVEKIEGDYFNIVGLPIFSLVNTLKKFGITIL